MVCVIGIRFGKACLKIPKPQHKPLGKCLCSTWAPFFLLEKYAGWLPETHLFLHQNVGEKLRFSFAAEDPGDHAHGRPAGAIGIGAIFGRNASPLCLAPPIFHYMLGDGWLSHQALNCDNTFFMFHSDLARQPVPRYQDAGQWGSCSHPAHAMYTCNSLSLQMFSVVRRGEKWEKKIAPCFFGGRRC